MTELQHGMNCAGNIPSQQSDCTCGLKYRIMLQTEREMHNAWRKRADEAEAELATTNKANNLSFDVGYKSGLLAELSAGIYARQTDDISRVELEATIRSMNHFASGLTSTVKGELEHACKKAAGYLEDLRHTIAATEQKKQQQRDGRKEPRDVVGRLARYMQDAFRKSKFRRCGENLPSDVALILAEAAITAMAEGDLLIALIPDKSTDGNPPPAKDDGGITRKSI